MIAGKSAVPMPQPTSMPASSRICRGASGRAAQPNRSAPCSIALAQRLGGERLAAHRLDLGVVLQPERERVHAAGQRHLVDRTLQRGTAGGLAGRAHEQRRPGIDPHRLVRRPDRRTGIQRVGGIGRRLDEIVERAGGGLGVVAQRRQPALVVGAQAQRLPGRAHGARRGRTSARAAAPASPGGRRGGRP